MSRESLSAVLRSSPCFLIQIFYGGQKGKLHGKLSVANEDLSHDTRKWSGRMNSEGESCHSGKLHLPFAMLCSGRCLMPPRWLIAITWCKTCANTCNASWIASAPGYQRWRICHSTEE